MKIISVDVGTRNSSYCIMEMNPDRSITIHAWRRFAFFDESAPARAPFVLCGETVTRKRQTNVCGKRAYFMGFNMVGDSTNLVPHYCCRAHAHAHTSKVIVSGRGLAKKYKLLKMDVTELRAHLSNCPGTPVQCGNTKQGLADAIMLAEQTGTLRAVPKQRTKKLNGNNVSTLTISEAMTRILDSEPAMEGVEYAFVEMQIKERYLMVQYLFLQYFMCKLKSKEFVKVVHGKHKLENFVRPKHLVTRKLRGKSTLSKMNHLKNKKSGVLHCAEMLQLLVPHGPQDWVHFFQSQGNDKEKQDDYADSFLQGLYCLGAYQPKP